MRFALSISRAVALAAAALALVACSTHRQDGTTVSPVVEIAINTIPEGARCVLERRGEQIAVVASTPQTVSVERSAREITLSCELSRHIRTVETIRSVYAGGPLKGAPSPLAGLVAAAIVASSPANYDYPSQYTLRLPSNVFADIAEREAKYAELREIIAKRHENRLAKVRNECPNAEACRINLQAEDAVRDAELAQLEASKAKAEIEPPAPVQPNNAAKTPAKKAS